MKSPVSVLALVLAFAVPVLAQGEPKPEPPKVKPPQGPPKITNTDPSPATGPPGMNFCVMGSGFGEKNADCEVTADGKSCLVLMVPEDGTYVRFFIPNEVKAGQDLTINIKTKVGQTSIKFKVIPKLDRKDQAERDARKYEKGETYVDPFKQKGKWLSINEKTGFNVVTGASPGATVEGVSGLPPGFFITVSFCFAEDNMDRQIEVKKIKLTQKGPFKVVFGPYPGKILLSGKYSARVDFDMAKQSALALKQANWPEALSEGDRVVCANLQVRELKEVGSPEELDKQMTDIRAHYAELCMRTTECLEALERAYASAGKSYFKKASGAGYEEDEWVKWVQARGIGTTEDDLKKIKADSRFLRGAHFNNDNWAKWVANLTPPNVQVTQEYFLFKNLVDVTKRHVAMKERYVGARDEKAYVEGDYLVSIVVKLALRYTQEIYERNKLAIPVELRAPQDFGAVTEAVDISRAHFEGHRQILMDRIGIKSLGADKKADKPGDKKQ